MTVDRETKSSRHIFRVVPTVVPSEVKREKKCLTYSSEVNTCQGLFKKRGSGDLRQFKCVFLWFAFPQFHLDYRAEETCLNGALKVVFFETANKKSNIIISCDFMLVRGLIKYYHWWRKNCSPVNHEMAGKGRTGRKEEVLFWSPLSYFSTLMIFPYEFAISSLSFHCLMMSYFHYASDYLLKQDWNPPAFSIHLVITDLLWKVS